MLPRTVQRKRVNYFNPWVASILDSNIDLQIVLDTYARAASVVEYINKANRDRRPASRIPPPCKQASFTLQSVAGCRHLQDHRDGPAPASGLAEALTRATLELLVKPTSLNAFLYATIGGVAQVQAVYSTNGSYPILSVTLRCRAGSIHPDIINASIDALANVSNSRKRSVAVLRHAQRLLARRVKVCSRSVIDNVWTKFVAEFKNDPDKFDRMRAIFVRVKDAVCREVSSSTLFEAEDADNVTHFLTTCPWRHPGPTPVLWWSRFPSLRSCSLKTC
ncbi:hypothetical protein HPB52_015891 [Rhipicephalus sanguineus]|uniref:Uncharacterized protein n=1 Tax=Rhipicephalus sanguineus TaxID=34632 RepID=A0A9D4PXX3_RHISA|nr:hypothetical protein HPB52_015891 [Rhipicephalus sanguineus]